MNFPHAFYLKRTFVVCLLTCIAAIAVPAAAHANSIAYSPNLNLTVTEGGLLSLNAGGSGFLFGVTTGLNGTDPTNLIYINTGGGAAIEGLSGLPQELSAGQLISPAKSTWSSGLGLPMSSFDTTTDSINLGNWSPGSEGFLGFYLLKQDGPHAGWADISIGPQDTSMELISLALEQDANTPLFAGQTSTPEPSTISLLALGGAGLIAMRRRIAIR